MTPALARLARAMVVAPVFAAIGAVGLGAQRAGRAEPFTFVVLGHIRGSPSQRLNPKLAELLEEVRALKPDLLVLSGDIINGDVDHNPARTAELEVEWNAVDSALATLHIPVYRVPGNHDISDVPSRDVWVRRYGRPPSVATFRGSRFILLSSAFIPPDGDTTHEKHIAGVDLDTAQLEFLRRTLADTGYAHTFVFTGHLLWWEPDGGRWWREVHPLLRAARVDNVFTGDYGPMKFSTLVRDGVRYYQGSIEGNAPSLRMLQHRMPSRLLSSQFDNFFSVRVTGDAATVSVHTLGEVSGGMFTPEQWRAIEDRPPPSVGQRLAPLTDSWKKKAVLGALVLALFGAGVLAGRASRRRSG